eukprot:4411379-Amphidinium_carterae.1
MRCIREQEYLLTSIVSGVHAALKCDCIARVDVPVRGEYCRFLRCMQAQRPEVTASTYRLLQRNPYKV